jgi:predicted HTH transcriptional regulator
VKINKIVSILPTTLSESPSPASVQVNHASGPKSSTEKTTEKILTTITTNPYITQSEPAKVCGITEDSIYWNIKKLKEGGIIRRIGPDKGGHWEVINKDVNE